MADNSSIAVLDCGSIGLNIKGDIGDDVLKAFGEQFVTSLTSQRVCYLKNHGLKQDMIDMFNEVSKDFLSKQVNIKEKVEPHDGRLFGWIRNDTDVYNNERPVDLKEAFVYCPADDFGHWPDADLEQQNKNIFEALLPLVKRLCDALSLGLGLEKTFFWNGHKMAGTAGGLVHLRANYYPPPPPPIAGDTAAQPDQVRFGEHSDFGTISLLIQDAMGGLEVDMPGQGFVPVTPIPETIVVLPGDMLQRWTADAIQAPKHRVVIPESESERCVGRQSVVLFVLPDREFVVKPVNGSDKYKPVTSLEYTKSRFHEAGSEY